MHDLPGIAIPWHVLTGRQDQGPWCQPAYVTSANDRNWKFYRWSLQDVVEKEGRRVLLPA